MNVRKFILSLLVSFLACQSLLAIDPISVHVSLPPPYTPYLHEYTATAMGKLQVSIVVNDSRLQNYPVKLQMMLEKVNSGIVMQTSEYASIAPMYVSGNTSEVLFGPDLAQYFNLQNLVISGIDRNQYIQTGRVPDGMYRVGFRVVDARRSEVVLSNTAFSAPGWYILNEPPIPNLPRNLFVERIMEPQNVKLEWFPRHFGSMNSAFPVQYRVEIFPMYVPGLNPNQVVQGSLPAFYDIVPTNQYFLSFDKYLLEPGVTYAWRVQAIGDESLTLFHNQGYSEVFSFTYGSPCPVPDNQQVTITGQEQVMIDWDTDPVQTAYELRFRLKNDADAIWHSQESFTGSAEINHLLSAGEQYECQVKARCNDHQSDYSNLTAFTLPESLMETFQCGILDTDTSVTNREPKRELWPDEEIYNGQFPVRLVQITGGNGLFSGIGRVRIPFLNNIQVMVEFTNIQVNELNQIYAGELRSIYNPDSKFLIKDVESYFVAGDDVGNIVSGKDSAAIMVDYVIPANGKATFNGNQVQIPGVGGGSTHIIDTPTGGTSVVDKDGNLYAVNQNGSISKVGKKNGVAPADLPADNTISSEFTITFNNDNIDLWTFDRKNSQYEASPMFMAEYESDSDYDIPWKLIPAGKSGKVTATISKGSLDHEKVKFCNSKGTEYFAKYENGEFKITILGGENGDGQHIYAVYQQGDSSSLITIGRLSVATYNMKLPKVKLVPVADAYAPDEGDIKDRLNDIYLPFGVEWTVEMLPAHQDMSWDDGDQALAKGDGFFSMYSDEMKALNKSFQQRSEYQADAVYLFLMNAITGEEETELLGDMPVGSQFGYLLSQNEPDQLTHTIAHELGHGLFQLWHTFSDKYKIPKYSTSNLMDYNEGNQLVKYQWDVIHDPQKMLFKWLQGDDEGNDITARNDVEWILEIYSPWYSEKFTTSNDQEEMQKYANAALKLSFTQEQIKSLGSFKDIIPTRKDGSLPVAILKHYPNAKFKGVGVYYTIRENGGIKIGKFKYFKDNFPVDLKLHTGEFDNGSKTNQEADFEENLDNYQNLAYDFVWETMTEESWNDKLVNWMKEIWHYSNVEKDNEEKIKKSFEIISKYPNEDKELTFKSDEKILYIYDFPLSDKEIAIAIYIIGDNPSFKKQDLIEFKVEKDKDYSIIGFCEEKDKDKPKLLIQVANEYVKDIMNMLSSNINKPLPGDPLISMELVGTNENNQSDNSGGMYGCVRFSRKDCDSKTQSLLKPVPRIAGRLQFHSGVDIKAPINTDLFSMYAGEVVTVNFPLLPNQCSNTNKAGNVIIIKSEKVNGKTIFVYYCHLNEKSDKIKVGSKVKQGDLIGKTGSTGNACGISDWRDHVHIIIYEGSLGSNNKVNPLDYFNTKFNKTNGNKVK